MATNNVRRALYTRSADFRKGKFGKSKLIAKARGGDFTKPGLKPSKPTPKAKTDKPRLSLKEQIELAKAARLEAQKKIKKSKSPSQRTEARKLESRAKNKEAILQKRAEKEQAREERKQAREEKRLARENKKKDTKVFTPFGDEFRFYVTGKGLDGLANALLARAEERKFTDIEFSVNEAEGYIAATKTKNGIMNSFNRQRSMLSEFATGYVACLKNGKA